MSAASALRLRTSVDRSARAFGQTRAALLGPRRLGPLARTRFAAVWLAREAFGSSWRELSRALGGRDRSTIINAYRRAIFLRESDPAFCRLTDRLLADTLDQPRA